MKHLYQKRLAMLLLLANITLSTVNAGNPTHAISNLYVFGDSLSDNGNLMAFNQDPTLPVPERLSNGPLAVERIAMALGFTMTPSLHLLPQPSSGNNYAVAGASSTDDDGDETTPDINLPTQVNAFLSRMAGSAPTDALYIVFTGGNDIRTARNRWADSVFVTNRLERRQIRRQARALINLAVSTEIAQINKLIAAGARHILVIGAPDIGAIPETDILVTTLLSQANHRSQTRRASRLTTVSSRLSTHYNRRLTRSIRQLERQHALAIVTFDLFNFLNQQIRYADFFGFSNTDEPCIFLFSQAGAVNPNCTDAPVATGFLFWDEIHPTTQLHQNAATAILYTLKNAYVDHAH